jgi:hypothetical protein
MDPRIEKLLAAFESKGWQYKGTVDVADWWFSDILQLLSGWSPVNNNLYITLLTDPEIWNKKIVWAIGFSTHIPDNMCFKFIDQISLNEIRKINLSVFASRITDAALL